MLNGCECDGAPGPTEMVLKLSEGITCPLPARLGASWQMQKSNRGGLKHLMYYCWRGRWKTWAGFLVTLDVLIDLWLSHGPYILSLWHGRNWKKLMPLHEGIPKNVPGGTGVVGSASSPEFPISYVRHPCIGGASEEQRESRDVGQLRSFWMKGLQWGGQLLFCF